MSLTRGLTRLISSIRDTPDTPSGNNSGEFKTYNNPEMSSSYTPEIQPLLAVLAGATERGGVGLLDKAGLRKAAHQLSELAKRGRGLLGYLIVMSHMAWRGMWSSATR